MVSDCGPEFERCTANVAANYSIIFLPGLHLFDVPIDFIGSYNNSILFTGYDTVGPKAIIDCPANAWIFFTHFKELTISHLQLRKCAVIIPQSAYFAMDYVLSNDSMLQARYIDAIDITNTVIANGPQIISRNLCTLCISSERTNFINVTFQNDFPSWIIDNVTLITFYDGELSIVDCTFLWSLVHIHIENGTLNLTGTTQFYTGQPAIETIDSTIHLLGEIQFKDGNSAILAINSTLNLAGNISFINNTAYQGGAISARDSRIVVLSGARVVFHDNHADYRGGAIYSTGNDLANYVSLIQRNTATEGGTCLTSFHYEDDILLEFVNNTAEDSGGTLYGISASDMLCHEHSTSALKRLFNSLKIEPDYDSSVSSNPLRVCVCPDQSTPDCLAILPDDQNIPQLNYSVYPGETFTISTAVVGFNFAPTDGLVYAQFLDSNASLGIQSYYVQSHSHTLTCSKFSYSVLSDQSRETLVLTTNERRVLVIPAAIQGDITTQNTNMIGTNQIRNPTQYYIDGKFAANVTDSAFRFAGNVVKSLQYTPVFITVNLLECPLGFTLSDMRKCECHEKVVEHNLTCDIDTETVRRSGTYWVNATREGMIVHRNCPFGYCKPETVDVDLSNPDTQCILNHSGILCGGCQTNYSLGLGGFECLPNCSNSYVSLVIVFALAGIILVFVMKILNLTVTQGTINGFLFYANIVGANGTILFPEYPDKFISTVYVLIAWANLDFGFSTCFIEGLDGYWYTWLQFVFPFYIWAIGFAIILVSHYSTRLTKMFGDNSVSVLATLTLTSYSKLLQSVIAIFSFTVVEFPDNSTSKIWSFDGNVPYLGPKHIALFLFALAIVVFLWLPYTAVLLFTPWLRTQTHRKRLHWLKPILDAYYGPFKDKHHYWVGVLLVVRGVLFILFAAFFAVERSVNLLLIAVTSASLLAYTSITGSLYKKLYVTILENALFLNLAILAAGTLYIRLVGGNQTALISTSVLIAFLQFLLVMACRIYEYVIRPLINRCCPGRSKVTDDSQGVDDYAKRLPDVVTHSEISMAELEGSTQSSLPRGTETETFTDLREPLLA